MALGALDLENRHRSFLAPTACHKGRALKTVSINLDEH